MVPLHVRWLSLAEFDTLFELEFPGIARARTGGWP